MKTTKKRSKTQDETAPKTKTRESTAIATREVRQDVERRVRELTDSRQLILPRNYSVENAIKAAWLKIQDVRDKEGRPALEVATRASVYTSLLYMTAMGLSPQRRQCHFILYGKNLVCQTDYMGELATVYRIDPKADVVYDVVWSGDVVEQDLIARRITRHERDMSSVTGKLEDIESAYCVIAPSGGRRPILVHRTREQITKAWSASKTWKPGKPGTFHEDTPDIACLRTVIRRASSEFIRTSDDSYLSEIMERHELLAAEAEVDAEIADVGNAPAITFDEPVEISEPNEAEVIDEAERVADKKNDQDHHDSHENEDRVVRGDGPGF